MSNFLSLDGPFQAQAPHQGETQNPLIAVVMLIVDCYYPVPTYVKDVSIILLFIQSQRLPAPSTLPLLLIVMYKIRCKTALLWSIISSH